MQKGTRTTPSLSDSFSKFTNRVNEQARFKAALETPSENPLPMLFFYGVAGAGKTWLKRRFIDTLKEQGHLPFASIDLDRQKGANPHVDDLRAMLHEISRQIGVLCPRFEIAYHVFNSKMSQASEHPAHVGGESHVEEVGEAAMIDLLEIVLHEIPVAGSIAKTFRLIGKKLSTPERQKAFAQWLKTDEGREDLKWLAAATLEELSNDMIRRLAVDLRERLPHRAGKACRAIILLDTWEHVRRGKATGLQHFTDSEKWVSELYGAAHSFNALEEAFPFLQIVAFGRDRATWGEYDPDLADPLHLEQHLVGGLSEHDARDFLGKCQINDKALIDALLKASAESPSKSGEVGYHAYKLGLCADTVNEERQRGITTTPESFVFPRDKQNALTLRFLQSLDEAGRLRITRLALTPRFNDEALRAVCVATDSDTAALLERDLRGYTFVQPGGIPGWFVLHALMTDTLRELSAQEGLEADQQRHKFWQDYWQKSSKKATDAFAGLAWYHHWHLDQESALGDWNTVVEAARSRMDYVAHRQLLDWWNPLCLEQKRNLTVRDAVALHTLGNEFLSASLGIPLENFGRAEAAYRAALKVRTREQFPQDWAATQMSLGTALKEQAVRIGGRASADLLAQALTELRAVLEVYTRQQWPYQWAMTQMNLGIVLREQGIRTGGEAGPDLLSQAARACRASLEVRTRKQLPQDWAMTQIALGNTLYDQGIRTDGEGQNNLLAQAVEAFCASLEVCMRDQSPQEWAMIQNNLGLALSAQGFPADGEVGADLLARAVEAFRAALEIRTREQMPQAWAMTQNNLGCALRLQGIRTEGKAGANLLALAVVAFRAALEVRTREQLPQQWAMTQGNLGLCLIGEGTRTSGEASINLLVQGVEALHAALEVCNREQLPQQWAMAQNNLSIGLLEQGIRIDGEAGVDLLTQAAKGCHAALEIYNREQLPQQWAMTQVNLGGVLIQQGIRIDGETGVNLLAQAVKTLRAALEVYNREQFPQQWALAQNNVGAALRMQGIRTDGEEGIALLAQSVEPFRAALEVFNQKQFPQQWDLTQKILADVLTAMGKDDESAEVLRMLEESNARGTETHE